MEFLIKEMFKSLEKQPHLVLEDLKGFLNDFYQWVWFYFYLYFWIMSIS